VWGGCEVGVGEGVREIKKSKDKTKKKNNKK
jgi:hypothetical protein